MLKPTRMPNYPTIRYAIDCAAYYLRKAGQPFQQWVAIVHRLPAEGKLKIMVCRRSKFRDGLLELSKDGTGRVSSADRDASRFVLTAMDSLPDETPVLLYLKSDDGPDVAFIDFSRAPRAPVARKGMN